MTISRDWATPLTIGAFLLMAVTGILMFFHLDTGLNKAAHEWLGWAMVIGVAAHVVANWPAFARHFSRATGQAIVGVFAVLLIGSFFVKQEGGGSPAGVAISALTLAPVANVAALTGEPVDTVVARLAAAGFQVTDPSHQTIAQLVGKDRERTSKALRAALMPASPGP
ncbi:MAG: hypothetical protein RI907_1297 [Pseudomonadota bacterium]